MKIKSVMSAIVICMVCSKSYALAQKKATIGMTGVENTGAIYVHITPNPNSCLYSGVYFTQPAIIDKALSVALSAKMASKTVQINYDQPKGANTQCIGQAIYIE
ncbi:hypothetical protein RND59_08710 [Vibrio ruber]|uniref:hypothetical protein n=1 Tax=Vibrio ruber TaxID=184755 RepID=UPI0028935DE6|nr:hypothetical protein [Vibrio ruber]WNJ94251.1 hypothetical protein RND59_08710 [Vibrio ruber]